jgi:hypothetical protein
MLPTKYKEKLPRHLSYPVGFDLLARELRDVPQADKLEVSFHAHAGRTTETEQKRRSGDYFCVLTASFRYIRMGYSESKVMKEQGLYDPNWSLYVYAVSRKHRSVASQLLCEKGIPAIVAWLRAPRRETWLQGRKEIHVYFRETDPAVLVEET